MAHEEFGEFEGFRPEAFSFLRSLKRNNSREWFLPRKEKYEELLKAPMQDLVADLGQACAKSMPETIFDPKKAVYRVYRDVRFSDDKSPYKTHLAASFQTRRVNRYEEAPGYYVHIEVVSVFVAGGLHSPSGEQLRKIRESISTAPELLLKVVKSPSFRKRYREIQGSTLKTAPRGVDPEHPMIEWLRHKQFYVIQQMDPKAALKRDFARTIASELRAMRPFVQWVEHALKAW